MPTKWHCPGMLTWAPSPSGRLLSLFISLSLFRSGFSRCTNLVHKKIVNFESAPGATIWWSWNSQWWCWWSIRIAPFFWHLLFKFMYFLHFCNLQCLCCRSQNSSLDGQITLQSQKRWWPFFNQPSVDLDADFRYTEWDCWNCYHWWQFYSNSYGLFTRSNCVEKPRRRCTAWWVKMVVVL